MQVIGIFHTHIVNFFIIYEIFYSNEYCIMRGIKIPHRQECDPSRFAGSMAKKKTSRISESFSYFFKIKLI